MQSLSEALKTNNLEEFIKQQEAAGVAPIYQNEFDKMAEKVIKSSREEGQTLRSLSGGAVSRKLESLSFQQNRLLY